MFGPKKLLEILKFPKGTFSFEDPESFSCDVPILMKPFQGEVSVFFFLNSRSLLYDPLDWHDLEAALTNWNRTNCQQGEVPDSTRLKFDERQRAEGSVRRYGNIDKKVRVLTLMSKNHLKADSTLLRQRIRNSALLKQVIKINKGDREAATLGLFPHALKKLVCDRHPDGEDRMERLSHDIISACADRFRRYQALSARADKLRRGNDERNTLRCLDPFHFLEPLPNRKTTRLRATCTCDLRMKKKKRKAQKSRGFKSKKSLKKQAVTSNPVEDTTGLDHKYPPRSQKKQDPPLTQTRIRDFLVPCPGVT